jgi:tripartite-type tricarboxylate transporter receptor subunit TctC
MNRRNLLAAMLLLAASCASFAQAWPTKPVRLVVAGPPGGSADLIARIVAEPLAKELGRPVIVEDKPGGAGVIAVNDLLHAPHDGHTLLVGVNSLVSEIPHIVKLPFDAAKDIRPLAELGRAGLVLIANPSVPAKNLSELIAYAKANPGKVAYASYSLGTMSHVLGLILNQSAHIELVHVPYKGSTPALSDVMGGHVPLMFDGVATSLPHIKGGKVKALAISTPVRMPQLPDVPTFRELGYPQMEAIGWMGLWCTPDAPAAVQARARDAMIKVLAEPAVKSRILDAGFRAGLPRTPAEMQAGLQADYTRVGTVLDSIGFKPE